MRAKQRLPLIGTVVSLLTAALVLPNLVGQTARLVDLIAFVVREIRILLVATAFAFTPWWLGIF